MSVYYTILPVDQVSPMNCWHAASQMIWSYWQTATKKYGPMNTVNKNYIEGKGIAEEDLGLLAATVGLKIVPNPNRNYESFLIEDFLKKCGPLFCVGLWYGSKHVIVLHGIDRETIFFINPNGGIKSSNTAQWFNRRLLKTDGCLMYGDPNGYLRSKT